VKRRFRRLKPRSIRGRLALLTGLFVMVIAGTAGVVTVITVRAHLIEQADTYTRKVIEREFPEWPDQIVSEGSTTSAPLPTTPPIGFTHVYTPQEFIHVYTHQELEDLTERLDQDPRLTVQFRAWPLPMDQTGQQKVGDLPLWPGAKPKVRSVPVQVWTSTQAPGRETNIRSDWSIVITNTLEQERRVLDLTILAVAFAVGGFGVLFAATTWFVTGRALRPVEAIRRDVAEITAHDLDRRVLVPDVRDEIARLAITVNATLSRLQRAVAQQRQFVADASHEIRSPLAALRAELEIALEHPGNAHWPQAARGALGDTERLQQLVTDLLVLARLDATEHINQHHIEQVDLIDLARAQTQRRSPPGHLRVRLDTDQTTLLVPGRKALLARLLGNLLDNAERHADSTITIRAVCDDSMAALEVLDDGPGIRPEDRERVFDRFTRLDEARDRQTGGAGLGLAIARRIATAHHGTLQIADSSHGAKFVARLPTNLSQ
jgi:signal transduction histidine kinase